MVLAPLGPAPVRTAASGLSGERAAVLEYLQQRHVPVTIAALAEELGVHPNTVRLHLRALEQRSLVVRARAPARGRGRPPWSYTAAGVVEPDQRVRDYAGLATALAAHLAATSVDVAADALNAGRVWGRELATERHQAPARGAAAARRQVVGLFEDLGFDPSPNPAVTTVALRRCPLLDAAKRYPQVVCQVHLGIVRGAMDVLGGDPERTDLVPFAEPGACRLRLLTRG